MKLWDWFRPKKPDRLVIEFSYHPDDYLRCRCSWPTGLDEEAQLRVIQDFASILANLRRGSLYSFAEHAVVVHGHTTGETKVSQSVLVLLNSPTDSAEEPVIPATDVFKPPEGNGDSGQGHRGQH